MAGKTDDLRIMAGRLQSSAGGRGRHSPVYRWLFRNADAFQRLLDETQPSWKSVASALIDLAVRDGTGKPPTAECVRQAWNAVKKARLARNRSPHLSPSASPPLSQVVSPVADPPSAPFADSREAAKARMRAQFKPVTIHRKEQ